MLSDNVAVLLKETRTRECFKGLCNAKEKEKVKSVTAALPLTFFLNGVKVLQVQYITRYFNKHRC